MILTIKHLSGSDLFTHDCGYNTILLGSSFICNSGGKKY